MDNDFPTLITIDWYGEKLNIFQLIERLEAAQEVVKALNAHIEAREGKIEALERLLKKRDRTLQDMAGTMRDIARNLAGAGGQTHKDKDEVLLIAIYRLLGQGNAFGQARDMDDIPWADDVPF